MPVACECIRLIFIYLFPFYFHRVALSVSELIYKGALQHIKKQYKILAYKYTNIKYEFSKVKKNTIQYNTIQYNTIQYNTKYKYKNAKVMIL